MLSDAPRRLLMPEDLERPFRYATRRNPDLATRGGKIAVLGEELGRGLKPHQQYIADVATELNPPGSRLMFRYQMVIINEPRQVGKTTLLRPVFLDRCLMTPGTAAFMTAQLGKYASERWEDLVDDYEQSIFAEFVRIKRGKGDQKCIFPNESFIAPFPPQRDALHGESPDLVAVDEGWAFTEEEGRDLTRAYRPAMITRTRRQVWVLSAAGTAESEWWDTLVEAGRASVDDPHSTIAYFEHSADPDADPYDRETWEFHPGLDGLITLGELAEEAKPENNTHADFLRGFMNISTKQRDTTVLDLEEWDNHAVTWETRPDLNDVALAYDVAIDRSSASIWSAWIDTEGYICLHVMETRPDADWLPGHIRTLYAAGLTGIAADDGGPARTVTEQLRREGIEVRALDGRESATAWDEFKAAANAGRVRHDGSPALREAIELAAARYRGESEVLSRRHSLGAIDALIAAATAAWYAYQRQNQIQIF